MYKVSLNGQEILTTESEKVAYETLAFNSLKGGVCVMSKLKEGIDGLFETRYIPMHVITRGEAKEHKSKRS